MDTKEKIVTSFFELLDNRSFDMINVRQIMKKANLSRTLFYQYFDNKQDLVLYVLEELITQVASHVTPTRTNSKDIRTYKKQTLKTLAMILPNKRRFGLLMRIQGTDLNLLSRFQGQLKKVVFSRLTSQYPTVNNENIDYYAALFSISLLTTLQWYFEHADFSLEKLVDFIADGIFKGLFSVITSK